MQLAQINSYTNWGRLKEVWLGDVYPSHFYDHLESQVRDVFHEITEKTQHDLSIIERKLIELGVKVVRPIYNNINRYVIPPENKLEKPHICPRDYFLVYANTLMGPVTHPAWSHAVVEYAKDPNSKVMGDLRLQHLGYISSANSVRSGKDLYLDIFWGNKSNNVAEMKRELEEKVKPEFPNSRLHLLNNGGHVDACFAVIKPGLLLTSAYFKDYERTFPGWEKINVSQPEYASQNNKKNRHIEGNGKWWHTGGNTNRAFNEHVIKHALDWVGNYTETYFEVNCLVVDEHNVLMLGENEAVFRELERHGVTAHSLPFRTRTFWDGGLHCLTLDIRRDDYAIDLFPERSEQIYYY